MTSLTVKAKATVSAAATLTRDTGALSWNPTDFGTTADFVFGTGSAANEVNQIFDDDRTLAGAANENLDLSGVLTNVFGESVTLTKVKVLFIKNNDATQTLTVGGAASNAWVGPFADATDKITIPAGGFALFVAPTVAGWAVTAGTGDQLKIEASSGDTVSYRIVIAGIN